MTAPVEKQGAAAGRDGGSGFYSLRLSWSGLMIASTVPAGISTFLGWGGRFWWRLDLFAHFPLHAGLFLAGAGLLLLALGRPRAAALMLLLAAINGGRMLPQWWPTGRTADGIAMRVMSLNVLTRNLRHDAVVALVRERDPDVVVFQEIDRRWTDGLAELTDRYPHRLAEPRSDNFGILMLSRWPLRDGAVVALGAGAPPSVMAQVATPGGAVLVIGTHPVPPMSARCARSRNLQLEVVASAARAAQAPVVLLGDLNVSPWSHFFARLERGSGLRDSSRGFGFQPTWPSFLPTIPLDHCLASPELTVTARRVGPEVGSDHLPLTVDLVLPRQ